MARLEIFGLKKCSTCQKAVTDLQAVGHEVVFRDVNEAPLSEGERRGMLADFGEKLVNRASLTWRGMSDEERAADPVAQLGAKPALMKRPAIMGEDGRWLGWTANVKRALGVPA